MKSCPQNMFNLNWTNCRQARVVSVINWEIYLDAFFAHALLRILLFVVGGDAQMHRVPRAGVVSR